MKINPRKGKHGSLVTASKGSSDITKVMKLADFVNTTNDGAFEWKSVVKTVRDLVLCILVLLEEDITEYDVARRGLIVLCFVAVKMGGLSKLVQGEEIKAAAMAVIQVMQFYADHSDMQGLGLDTLVFLAEEKHHGATIVTDGGIQAAIGAMTRHKDDKNIHISGLRLLGLICSSHDNIMALVDRDCIALIVSSMAHHRDVKEIQRMGCNLFAIIASVPGNPEFIAIGGGVCILLATMRRHKEDVEIQKWGCAALAKLSTCLVTRRTVVNLGGVEIVCHALNTMDNESARMNAMEALRNFVINGAPQYFLVQILDRVDSILLTMRAMKDNLVIQQVGVTIIHALANPGITMDGKEREEIVGALQCALLEFPEDPLIQARGREALDSLRLPEQSLFEKVFGRLMRL